MNGDNMLDVADIIDTTELQIESLKSFMHALGFYLKENERQHKFFINSKGIKISIITAIKWHNGSICPGLRTLGSALVLINKRYSTDFTLKQWGYATCNKKVRIFKLKYSKRTTSFHKDIILEDIVELVNESVLY